MLHQISLVTQSLLDSPFCHGLIDSVSGLNEVWKTAYAKRPAVDPASPLQDKRPGMKAAIWELVEMNFAFFVTHSILVFGAIPAVEAWVYQMDTDFSSVLRFYIWINFVAIKIFVNISYLVIYGLLLIPNAKSLRIISEAIETKVKVNKQLVQEVDQFSAIVYDTCLVVAFMCLCTCLYVIPYVGPLLSFIYSCWQTSFYCFNYKWRLRYSSQSRTFLGSQRNAFFEARWMYHLGFGFPLTFLLSFFPLFTSLGIYAILFPIWVAIAQKSGDKGEYTGQIFPSKIGIFYESHRVAVVLSHFVMGLPNNPWILHIIKRIVPFLSPFINIFLNK